MDNNILLLSVQARSGTEKPRSLRASGRIPAVYYGRGKTPISLSVDRKQFVKLFSKAGESTIIELAYEDQKLPVLIHELQFDPISDSVAHIDFIHVDMNKEVTIPVKIKIYGVSPAVKNLGGILDIHKHEVKIRCLPKDLIQSLDVDVSPIIDFTTTIHVRDLNVPKTIKILDHPDDTVVTAVPPRAEEEEKPKEVVVEAAAGTAPAPEVGGKAAETTA